MAKNRSDGLADRLTSLTGQFKDVKNNIIDIFDPSAEALDKTRNDPSDPGLYFADSKLAHQQYDLDKVALTGHVPRFTWQYFVNIGINHQVDIEITKELSRLFGEKDISPMIKRIDSPTASITVNKHNAYNRWRVSQHKIEFNPVTLVMHDVVNGETLKFWELYYKYYFLDGHHDGNAVGDYELVPNSFEDSFRYGLQSNGIGSSGKYLIEYIDIFQIHGGEGKRIRLVHPVISKFDQTTLAYDSQEISELSFTFEYEYAVYEPDLRLSRQLGEGNTKNAEWEKVREYFGALRFFNIEIPPYNSPDAYARHAAETELLGPKPAQEPQGTFEKIGIALESIRDTGKAIADEVGRYNAVANQFNQLQEDVFGKKLIKIPLGDVRSFTPALSKIRKVSESASKLGRVSKQYKDIDRVSKSAYNEVNSLVNRLKPLSEEMVSEAAQQERDGL